MALLRETALADVCALVARAEAVRENEVRRLFARCPELTERERAFIAAMSAALIGQLLHGAISKIHEKDAFDREEALRHARILNELFGA